MIKHTWWPRPAPYLDVWHAMQAYTEARDALSADEIWLVEHEPVYTLGQAGKPEHILNSGSIPVVHSNRGGQVTYHGPGQIVAYCLIDLRRLGIFVKEYVALLEDVTIQVLGEFGLAGACRKPNAPGVYVPMHYLTKNPQPDSTRASGVPLHEDELAKIAALGIKVRNGCAYHGVALNVDMDLTPYLGINPCGYEGLRTVDLASCGVSATVEQVGDRLAASLTQAISAYVKS